MIFYVTVLTVKNTYTHLKSLSTVMMEMMYLAMKKCTLKLVLSVGVARLVFTMMMSMRLGTAIQQSLNLLKYLPLQGRSEVTGNISSR